MTQIPVCSHCGSDNVKADAYAEWNAEAEEWELSQVFDKGSYCSHCDGETTLEWKQVEPPKQPTLFELEDDDRPISGAERRKSTLTEATSK